MAEASERPSRGRIIALAAVAALVLVGIVIGVTYMTNGGTTPSGSESPTTSPTDTADPTDPTDTPLPTDSDDGDDADDTQPGPTTPSTTKVLTEPLGGQEAIDALGDKIEVVALRNGKTVEEVETLLLRDASARVTTDGDILYLG